MHFEHVCFVIIQIPETLSTVNIKSVFFEHGLLKLLNSLNFDRRFRKSTVVFLESQGVLLEHGLS